MSEMVERAARKLAGQWMVDDGYGEDSRASAERGEMWKNFRKSARLAIEAMREPTGAMLTAGRINLGGTDELHIDEAEEVWRKMIAAALTDKQP